MSPFETRSQIGIIAVFDFFIFQAKTRWHTYCKYSCKSKKGAKMSLLPIIYTSVLIFCGVVTTVLLVSYIIYKAKGGAPKPASLQTVKISTQPQRRPKHVNNINIVKSHSSHSHRNYRATRNQEDLMFYKKPVNLYATQPTSRKSTAPRVQVINKPTEKKIVVVRKSSVNSFDANNFLGYYNENERGVLIQA